MNQRDFALSLASLDHNISHLICRDLVLDVCQVIDCVLQCLNGALVLKFDVIKVGVGVFEGILSLYIAFHIDSWPV